MDNFKTQVLLNPPNASLIGVGDVDGPASSTDNAIVRFDGTTGKLIQNSSAILSDSPLTGTGSGVFLDLSYDVNMSGLGAATGIKLNAAETAVGSGAQYLIDAQVGGTSKFSINNVGQADHVFTNTALQFRQLSASAAQIREPSNNTLVFTGFDILFQTGTPATSVSIGSAGSIRLGRSAASLSAWGLSGAILQTDAQTYTNNSTAGSGTAASAVFSSFAQPTLAATNSSVTTTDAATVYIAAAPANGTNMTITNPYALWIDAGSFRLDGTTGAGAGAGTLTNAPSAGDPDKWIPINSDGVQYWMPVWAA